MILCFQPDKNSICSVNNLFKADKLVNTADHCFNIKMEFDAADGRGIFKPGGFGVHWSRYLAAMLPELADAFLSLSTEQRCTLEEKLEEYSIFIDNVKLPNL